MTLWLRRTATALISTLVVTGALGLILSQRSAPRITAGPLLIGNVQANDVEWRPERPPVERTPAPTATPTPAANARPVPASTPVHHAPAPVVPLPVVSATSVSLLDLDTGRYLWQSNPNRPWAPASLAKIFTAMVASDLMRLDAQVTVPASVTQLPWDSTVMGLSPGERLSVRELLDGVFLRSANDAAETLASAVTSRATFVADMNAKAARLSLHNTHFVNPTGLDGAGYTTTAYDLSVAATYLEYHYPALTTIAAVPSMTIGATATHKTFAMVNIDKMLQLYPGVYGLKTGWTEIAGGCLITTASRGGHRLLAVVFGSPAVYHEMSLVLDYGFETLGVLPPPTPTPTPTP
jgi:D-alanyl-D-alanine carboxypeptidase (penicillin-binding protein 5/6)